MLHLSHCIEHGFAVGIHRRAERFRQFYPRVGELASGLFHDSLDVNCGYNLCIGRDGVEQFTFL